VVLEAELQRVSPGRACDFVVETIDSVILIECKASRYTSKVVFAGSIERDTCTDQITEACAQVVDTASRRKDWAQKVGISNTKPLCGMIVVLDNFPFPNDPQLWHTSILPKIDQPVLATDGGPFDFLPQVQTATSLEFLAELQVLTGKTFCSLCNDKLSEPHFSDWREWLVGQFPERVRLTSMVLKPAAEKVIHRFGAFGSPATASEA
jgi:hypothetical protein